MVLVLEGKLTPRLSAVKFTTVETDIDLRSVGSNKFGDFATAQLSRYWT